MKFIFRVALLFVPLMSTTAFAGPEGTYDITSQSPMGEMQSELVINADGTGSVEGMMGLSEYTDATIDGDSIEFSMTVNGPMGEMEISYKGTVVGDEISGETQGPMGATPFSGTRSE